MKKIEKTSLGLALFYLFSILYFATSVQAQTRDANKICPQVVKELQMRIKSLKKVHKGMHNSVYSSLPLDSFDRYNRHLNILSGNLNREVNRMKGLLEKLQQDQICHEMAQGLSPHIQTMHEIQASIYTAIFDSNISNYKKLVEKFGRQVKDISGELNKHFSHS